MRSAEFELVPDAEGAEAPQQPTSSPDGPGAQTPPPEPTEPPPVAQEPKPAKAPPRGGPGGKKKDGVDSVAEFLESLDSVEGYATIYVRRHKPGGQEFVVDQDLESFTIGGLQSRFGGGRYVFTVTDRDKNQLFQRTVQVAGKPKQPTIPDEEPETVSAVQAVEGLRAELTEIRDQLRRGPQPGQEVHNPLGTALSIVEYLDKAQKPWMELLIQNTKTGPDPAQMLDLFFKGMEAAQAMTPPADPILPVLAQLAQPIVTGLQRAAAANEERPMEPKTATITDPAEGVRRPIWDVFLVPWISTLQGWAANEKDPQMRAEFVADEIPDEALQILGEQFARGDVFLAEFFTLHPETRSFEPWYRQFWGALEQSLVWEEEEDETEGEAGEQAQGEPEAGEKEKEGLG